MNVGKKWFQWFWVIEPLGGFGAEVFRLFRCCAPVSWTCCEGGKTMWVKSSKSEMTFLNSAVFSEACRICRCICRLICPIPSMGSGSKARKRRLDGCTQFVKFGTYPISIIYIFCPTGSDKKSIYSQFLPIPTWIQRICFSTFLLQLSQILTSLLLIC